MIFDINVVVLIGQLILTGIIVFIALKKVPKENAGLDASTTASYAQAAKAKGEENAQLMLHITQLESRLDAVENKHYKISIEFITGEPPEVLKAEVAQIILPIVPKLQVTKL